MTLTVVMDGTCTHQMAAKAGAGEKPRAAATLDEDKSEEEAEKELQKALAAKAKSKKNALKFMKEMLMYFGWVLCFSGTIVMTRDGTMSYQFANLFESWVISNDGWQDSMKTVEDFWSFTTHATSKVLSDDLYKTLGDDFGSSRDGNFLYGNKRIGQLRIRQVRVPSVMCQKEFLQTILGPSSPEYGTIRCYPEFSTSLTVEKEFTKESVNNNDFLPDLEAMPWFKYYEHKEIAEMSDFGAFYTTYPGSGYVLDIEKASTVGNDLVLTVLPVDPPRKPMNVTMQQVIDSKWIDVKTRAVFIDFTFYNPNINLFLVVRIAVEFLPSGIVTMYPTFRIVNPFRFKMDSLTGMMTMAMLGVVLGLTLFYLQQEVRSLIKGPAKYVKSIWNCMAFLNVACMGLVGYFYATNQMQVMRIFEGEGEVYQGDLQKLGFSLDQEKNFEGMAVILMWARLYQYCSVSRKLSTLTRTMAKSMGKLFIIVFLILIPMAGFTMGMSLVLGTNTYVFSTFTMSCFTLFRGVLGDFDYTEWGSNRYLGPISLLLWVCFTSVLVLNIIVAVLCDAFAAVTIENEEFDEKGIKSVADIFIESGLLGGRLSAMLNKKAAQVGDMEAALAAIDADGDGLTDLAELEAWMKATGAEEILGMGAMEVMARYDSDGSGQLDDDEMQEIKDWVARERQAAEEAAAKENMAITDMDYEHDKRGGGPIDATAVMALMQQGGGGMSLAMEEKILNIENNVMDIKDKVIKLLAKVDTMSQGMVIGGGGGAAQDRSGVGLPGTADGSPAKTINLKAEGGKMIASKALVPEEG